MTKTTKKEAKLVVRHIRKELRRWNEESFDECTIKGLYASIVYVCDTLDKQLKRKKQNERHAR